MCKINTNIKENISEHWLGFIWTIILKVTRSRECCISCSEGGKGQFNTDTLMTKQFVTNTSTIRQEVAKVPFFRRSNTLLLEMGLSMITFPSWKKLLIVYVEEKRERESEREREDRSRLIYVHICFKLFKILKISC